MHVHVIIYFAVIVPHTLDHTIRGVLRSKDVSMDELDAMIDSLIPRRTSGRRFLAGLLLGMIGGAAAAMLLMPHSGPALRALVAERARAWLGQARSTLAGQQQL